MGRVIVFCLLMAFAVDSLQANNPILPDWYADPQIRLYGDTYWIFPTPSKEFKEQIYLDAFSSKDLKTWKKHPNIMTTNAFPWAKGAVWAPDAIEKGGRYYIFFGANNAYPIDRAKRDFRLSDRFDLSKRGGIGVGVADRPEGTLVRWERTSRVYQRFDDILTGFAVMVDLRENDGVTDCLTMPYDFNSDFNNDFLIAI